MATHLPRSQSKEREGAGGERVLKGRKSLFWTHLPLSKGASMSGFTQQLPALIGVVIGASTSYLVGAAIERARWRREQWARWDEKRAQAYAEYSHAVKTRLSQFSRLELLWVSA